MLKYRSLLKKGEFNMNKTVFRSGLGAIALLMAFSLGKYQSATDDEKFVIVNSMLDNMVYSPNCDGEDRFLLNIGDVSGACSANHYMDVLTGEIYHGSYENNANCPRYENVDPTTLEAASLSFSENQQEKGISERELKNILSAK